MFWCLFGMLFHCISTSQTYISILMFHKTGTKKLGGNFSWKNLSNTVQIHSLKTHSLAASRNAETICTHFVVHIASIFQIRYLYSVSICINSALLHVYFSSTLGINRVKIEKFIQIFQFWLIYIYNRRQLFFVYYFKIVTFRQSYVKYIIYCIQIILLCFCCVFANTIVLLSFIFSMHVSHMFFEHMWCFVVWYLYSIFVVYLQIQLYYILYIFNVCLTHVFWTHGVCLVLFFDIFITSLWCICNMFCSIV